MDSFLAYLGALYHNWLLAMSAGPFLLDRLGKWFWSGYDAWFKQRRERLVYSLCLIGFIVANFLAFNDERGRFLMERQQLDSATNKKERSYAPIDKGQVDELTALLKPLMSPQEWAGVAVVDNPSAVKRAEIFEKVVRSAGGTSTLSPTVDDDSNESGVILYIRNPLHPNQHDQKVLDAFRLSNIPVKPEDLEGDAPIPLTVRFEMEVSYPPL